MLLFFDVLVRIKKKKKIGGRDKNGERKRMRKENRGKKSEKRWSGAESRRR